MLQIPCVHSINVLWSPLMTQKVMCGFFSVKMAVVGGNQEEKNADHDFGLFFSLAFLEQDLHNDGDFRLFCMPCVKPSSFFTQRLYSINK